MTGLSEVFVSVLRNAPAVVALVADRIGPRKLKQGKTWPAVRFLKVVSTPWAELNGHPGMADTVFQFTCVAGSDHEAGELAETVRQALLRSAVGASAGGVTIKSIRLRNDYSLPFGVSPDASDAGAFMDALEFFVQHTLPPVEG